MDTKKHTKYTGLVVIENINLDEGSLFESMKLELFKDSDIYAGDNIALSMLVSNPDIFHIGRWSYIFN